MTNVTNLPELVKDESTATPASLLSASYSNAEKQTLLSLFNEFFGNIPSSSVRKMMRQFFEAILQSDFDSMADQEYRTKVLLFHNDVAEMLDRILQWETSGYSKNMDENRLLDIATDYLIRNHLEDSNQLINSMFEAHYRSHFIENMDAENRADIVLSYFGLLKFNDSLSAWHKTHHESKERFANIVCVDEPFKEIDNPMGLMDLRDKKGGLEC